MQAHRDDPYSDFAIQVPGWDLDAECDGIVEKYGLEELVENPDVPVTYPDGSPLGALDENGRASSGFRYRKKHTNSSVSQASDIGYAIVSKTQWKGWCKKHSIEILNSYIAAGAPDEAVAALLECYDRLGLSVSLEELHNNVSYDSSTYRCTWPPPPDWEPDPLDW